MNSTHNGGTSVAVERFIRTLLENKIYQERQLITKSNLGYLNKLVDECNRKRFLLAKISQKSGQKK